MELRLTLRAKGMIAFAAVAVFSAAVGTIATQERHKLLAMMQELEQVHALEERLAKVNTSVAHAVLKLQEIYYSSNARPNYERIVLDIEAIQAGFQGLKQAYPKADDAIAALDRDLAALRATPTRGALAELQATLYSLVRDMDGVTRQIRQRGTLLSESYRTVHDAITLIIIIGASVGSVVFGGLVMLFFTRLTWDIKKLETRAMEVVTGYRGGPLEVTRRDEIGSLMESVNRMQSTLRAHESRLELARHQRFHQDKMAAIGSVATAITHEINNPIAAIEGVAQYISDMRAKGICPIDDALCQPELILEQTRRIAQITRQISEIATPRSAEPQLLDFNSLVRSTCNFTGYDKRFRNINLVLELDPMLPAVTAVANHLTQVLMNLLINAADATEGITGRKPEVTVATAAKNGAIHLTVADNGCGMDRETTARAFDETFTTKLPGKGSGLGLFICKSLIEQRGGRIELESAPGRGARVTVELPLQPGANA